MIALLYGLAAFFLLLWVIGFFVLHIGGAFIHILLALALGAMLVNLFPQESVPNHRPRPRR
jgi:hypothetical protein